MPSVPTVHCRLPFCIATCSMELVGSAFVERELSFDSVYGEEYGISLCMRSLMSLNIPAERYTIIPDAYTV